MAKRPFKFIALLFALALFAACGADTKNTATTPGAGGGASSSASSAAPATANRIVSLSATATEMLFAIDAGRQVVAVDDQSNFPPEAPKTDLSGYTPNVEAIAGYKPDLVVIPNDTAGLVDGLKNLQIDVLILPPAKTLDDSYSQLQTLGERTGHVDDAKKVADGMKSDIAALMKDIPTSVSGKTYYYELDNTFFTATSTTFIGALLDSTGLKNIGDASDDGTGFPQLSQEKIISANPDFIFLADTKCCGQDAATVAQRPGWSTLTAVKQRHVVALDDDVASRWGPRVVDLLRTVVDALKSAA